MTNNQTRVVDSYQILYSLERQIERAQKRHVHNFVNLTILYFVQILSITFDN